MKLKDFCASPRGHFTTDSVSYLIFLAIFSYFLMCNHLFYEKIETSFEPVINLTNSSIDILSNNTTYLNETELKFPESVKNSKRIAKLPFLEYVLVIWITAFIFEELNQVILMKK